MTEKNKLCRKVYIAEDATEARHWTANAVALEFRFEDGAAPIRVTPEDYPASMQRALMFFGISEKDGNAYAGAKTPAEARERFLPMHERLALGEFVKERIAGETRPTMLADAVKAALEDQGQTVDDALYQKIRTEKLATKEQREATEKIPTVKAHLDRIRVEAAKARAKVSTAAAKEADATDLSDFAA